MEFFLLQVTDTNNAANYLPVALQMLFAVGLIATIIVGSNLLGPKRATSDKLQNFESGIQIRGNARQPMAVKYFLVAILFVLFDVEVIFFYPYAVNFKELGWSGFMAVVMFVSLFIAGLVYIFKKGSIEVGGVIVASVQFTNCNRQLFDNNL
ncbi:MAG: NADH-quinone oxidoreductase subunit A [Chitinophagaceae bacterium]|nr:NADH-quinone oxidoreductase subunit A [Chitinophagaceae bacterium]